jgi:hypothetical protein
MLQVEENLIGAVQDIVLSYEARISTIGAVIGNTYGVMQESKAALVRVNSQLRETLAGSASLRKKDFDNMVAEIEAGQDERHQEIGGLLAEFVLVQKETAYRLKDLLTGVQVGRQVDFKTALSDIQVQQEEVQKRVVDRLRACQDEQEGFVAELHRLLTSGRSMRVSDFKAALRSFSARSNACKEEDSGKSGKGESDKGRQYIQGGG